MRHLMTLLLVAATASAQGGDVRLRGERLTRFLDSRGKSESGHSVHWRIPARALSKPHRSRNGYHVFVHKKIGLVVGVGTNDLAEIRRRGGIASVRGSVFRVPPSRRIKGDPEYAIAVREIRRRRQ